ncbi:hypothetical protein Ancab_010606, partial [Ancistrocladus abbreviatus]
MGPATKGSTKRPKLSGASKKCKGPLSDVSNTKSNPTFDMVLDKPTSSHIMKDGGLETVNSTPLPDESRPIMLDLNCLNPAEGISHEPNH